jgi:hydrogenase maturation protease
MTQHQARCLILACGNTLRGDDGIGPWLAQWAAERFRAQADVRILSRQQWTPELAEETACADSVLFIDCAEDTAPGAVRLVTVEETAVNPGLATHHLGAAELLAMGRELYDSLPRNALLLTVGAGSTELGEEFSVAVQAALPEACSVLEETVLRLLSGPELPKEAQSA